MVVQPTGGRSGDLSLALFLGPEELKSLLEDVGFVRVDFAGIKFNLRFWSKKGFPVRIPSNGDTDIIYFEGTRKINRNM
jgi:hypothetical protein